MQDLFKGHKNLLIEFNKLIPANFRISVETRPHYNEAIEYMRRVKEETKDTPGIYTEFISVLRKYQDKSITIDEVNSSVRVIMSNYPILIESFKVFLPSYNENSSSEEEDDYEPVLVKPAKKKNSPFALSVEKILIDAISEPINKNELTFFKRLKKVMEVNSAPGTDYYLECIKCFELYSDSVITRTELAGMVEPLFRLTNYTNFLAGNSTARRFPKEENREIMTYIQSQLTELFEVFKLIAASRESSRRKYGWFFRPLSDFDTAKSKRHGHSYLEIQRPRILREKPNPEINGLWVSVPYGSEDVSFRNFRKNAFEDALFKCEDERFELDMATENASYTLRLLESAIENSALLTQEQQKNFQLPEKIFSKIRLRPVLSIYSEHAPKIIEMLKNNPVKSLPVVISRIKNKIETWKKTSKYDSERVWKETVEKNFYKSLDHRSFYFKQNEKKMTNAKSFLSEAKARHLNREESKNLLRKYLKKELTQHSFEFLGGSRNTLFFNSFSGLSSGVVHKISPLFLDEVLEEFQLLDSVDRKIPYANAPEYATLPQFRLLFTCQQIVYDSIRLILFTLEKSTQAERSKMEKWLYVIFKEFMGMVIPADIVKFKIEEFFEGKNQVEEVEEPKAKLETTKKIINKWINNTNSTDKDIVTSCVTENAQDPMALKKDASFVGYLPLLKDCQVIYAPHTVYSFLRFFYDIYERLLKVKLILSQGGKEQEYSKIEYGNYEFDSAVETEYNGFLKTVCQVLRNTFESGKFEDKCRSMFGNDSYVFFTFDKLVNYAAKSLQLLSSDECSNKAAVLHSKFAKTKLNEEMYLADFLGLSPNSQGFRFHWNKRFKILSITYIESPYEKLPEVTVKNAQKYRKTFLNTMSQVNAVEDIKTMLARVESYLKSNDISLTEYASGLFYYQNTSYGMIENSYKLQYIPPGEDFLLNRKYYSQNLLLEIDQENYLCLDKNSAYQKYFEHSEKKFKLMRESWITHNI